MYKVFVDFHHASLLNSFILLFGKRLGGEVYRPVGKEWYDKGFWRVYDHPATVEQFLGLNQSYTPIDNTEPLNRIRRTENGIYYCQDIDSGQFNKAITLDSFYRIKPNIVIATLPQHIESFKQLAESINAKMIYQVGNNWTIEDGTAKNIMASANIKVPDDINFVKYHQEFDTDVFRYRVPNNDKKISSFVNCFSIDGGFKEDYQLFTEVEKLMPDWIFGCYGGQCRDGAAHGSKQLAEYIANSRFIWHTKNGGDGYGHIIYNSASIARPLIVKIEYYQGKMGEELMVDGETCIGIDGLSKDQIIEKILYYNQDNNYFRLIGNIRNNFINKVNFDREENEISIFLQKLL